MGSVEGSVGESLGFLDHGWGKVEIGGHCLVMVGVAGHFVVVVEVAKC